MFSLITNGPVARSKLDTRLVHFWLQLQLLAALIFFALLWLCTWLRSFGAKKTLHGQTVLITNAEAALSEALAEQLTGVYHCRVALLRQRRRRGSGEGEERMPAVMRPSMQHHLRTELDCDLLDALELEAVKERVRKELGWVDVVIENGVGEVREATDVRRFIEATSEGIRSTINLLITFIPALAQSERPHYISLQPSCVAARPFLDADSDVRRLMTHLHQQQHPADVAMYCPQLQVSTVVVHGKRATGNGHRMAASSSSPRDLSVAELAERVIAGICREQPLLELHERRGVLEYVFDLVCR